jgi:hypothetical protein
MHSLQMSLETTQVQELMATSNFPVTKLREPGNKRTQTAAKSFASAHPRLDEACPCCRDKEPLLHRGNSSANPSFSRLASTLTTILGLNPKMSSQDLACPSFVENQ